jgi:nitrite reductase/ring-hydroxylating ferredoxin subunit
MPLNSNLRFFFIVSLIIILTTSCHKEKYDVVPNEYVDFTIDLNDIEFSILSAIGNYVYINAGTNNWGRGAAGYDGNGIIVYSTLQDEFSAYDRTCPHDYAINGQSIKVTVDFTIAICPKCGTTYALAANGTPASGPGQYPLKNYKTSFDGRYIHVWNNRYNQ